jgi:hypothetical protein
MRRPNLFSLSRTIAVVMVFFNIVCAIGITGCDSSPYKTYTQRRGVGHFAFVYPAEYRLSSDDSDSSSTSLGFKRRYVELQDYTFLTIFVWKPGDEFANAQGDLDDNLERAQRHTNFKVTDNPTYLISGVSTIGFEYSYTTDEAVDFPGSKATLSVVRKVFFDYGGLIWEIGINSNAITAEADKVDFERILATFDILM